MTENASISDLDLKFRQFLSGRVFYATEKMLMYFFAMANPLVRQIQQGKFLSSEELDSVFLLG